MAGRQEKKTGKKLQHRASARNLDELSEREIRGKALTLGELARALHEKRFNTEGARLDHFPYRISLIEGKTVRKIDAHVVFCTDKKGNETAVVLYKKLKKLEDHFTKIRAWQLEKPGAEHPGQFYDVKIKKKNLLGKLRISYTPAEHFPVLLDKDVLHHLQKYPELLMVEPFMKSRPEQIEPLDIISICEARQHNYRLLVNMMSNVLKRELPPAKAREKALEIFRENHGQALKKIKDKHEEEPFLEGTVINAESFTATEFKEDWKRAGKKVPVTTFRDEFENFLFTVKDGKIVSLLHSQNPER